jgi:hypothetical protein
MSHQGLTFNAHRLEHPYGVGFIDDIHNFFPEILYDTGLFQTPFVGFIQRRVESLFEEDYNRNRTQYRMFQQARRRRDAGILTPASSLVGPTMIPLATVAAELERAASVPVGSPAPARQVTPWNQTVHTAMGDIGSLFAVLGIQQLQTQMEEQSEIPTEAQIESASILTSLEPPSDVECSICQDHSGPNNQTEWRILRHCNHQFHRLCIDTWFQRNAHCPVCRHDIRQTF